MSRANRHRAMECVAGSGSWLTPGDKLALILIGDLVADGNPYWEAQESLGERMGVSRRSAGRAIRKLTEYGALEFLGWQRTRDGATVKTFAFAPEKLSDMGETFTPDMGAAFTPDGETDNGQVGSSMHPGGKNATPTWEEHGTQVGRDSPQTGMNHYELIVNPDKLAAPPPTSTTLEDPIALENERQRQRLALAEMAHANG